ncbi:MAG: ORF6N domain-containing protein [Nitrospirae bacterium]|nr:ORF6N domain-containing protein [Nitrospirota bacterium]
MTDNKTVIPEERIEKQIFLISGQKVMLSTDLAELYGIEPRVLVQAVKRNIERFPEDFMFQLTDQEVLNLKSQFVISSWGGSRRAAPYAFTEQGVAMLSSVLRNKRAILFNLSRRLKKHHLFI